MKALSVKQPYAGLIIAGIKTVENRSWAPRQAPGTLAICSTATPDAAKWWQPMRARCAALGLAFPEALCKINGAILGTVVFNYCVWVAEDGETETNHPTLADDKILPWWIHGDVGFILEHPRRLAAPIPITGRLGLYNLTPAQEAEVKRQLDLTNL